MSLPFDPSTLSVKKASSKLASLSIEELEALRDAELSGKNRITLVIAIDAELSDDLDEAATTAAPTPHALFSPSIGPIITKSQRQLLHSAALAGNANPPSRYREKPVRLFSDPRGSSRGARA